ncbi:MAG: TIGR04282 family arsenosugar biosynthesis glycosyltransferase [Bacteroidota bacterium]
MFSNDQLSTALILFVKNPELGKVKTRLAKDAGDENALKIYKALLGHTREITVDLPLDRLLYYSTWIEENDEWDETQFKKRLQKGDDLGSRMSNAFAEAFNQYERVLIIGSDCAQLNEQMIEHAIEQLKFYPFVIGPSEDGGYYLLGMQKFTPSVFEDIPWSTKEVLLHTLDRIRDLEASYYLLPKLSDIDYLEDWKKHGWPIEGVEI